MFEDLQQPRLRQEWRRLKGWLIQLQRFIPNGVEFQSSLQTVESTGHGWQQFLDLMKQHLFTVVLAPTPCTVFQLVVDASSTGWGGILVLQGKKIVACASGVWPTRVSHWKSNDFEAEALVKSLSAFKGWLFGSSITIYSDNLSTVSFSTVENHSMFVRRRLEMLSQYCLDYKFLPGSSNLIADLLSRQKQLLITRSPPTPRVFSLTPRPFTAQAWQQVHHGHVSVRTAVHRARLLGYHVSFSLLDRLGRACSICRRFTPLTRTSAYSGIPTPLSPGEALSLDYMGPIVCGSQRKFILVVICRLTKLLQAFVVPDSTGRTTRRCLQMWFSKYRIPHVICWDNARAFTEIGLQTWLGHMSVRRVCIPPYDHRANGVVERSNRTLIERIRRLSYGHQGPWIDVVQDAITSYNTSYHTTIGMMPVECWHGGQRKWQLAHNKINQFRTMLNKHRHSKIKTFFINQKVMVYRIREREQNQHKFAPLWDEGVIKKRVSNHLWEVVIGHHSRVYHMDLLRSIVTHAHV